MVHPIYGNHAKSYSKNCFAHHIQESIDINRTRSPIYSELTDGKSDKIFHLLINSERLSLVPAAYYDFKANSFQKMGVPVFCYEFMSMNATPNFDPNNRTIPQGRLQPFNWKDFKRRLADATKIKNVESIKEISLEAIRDLDSYPHFYCMTRHLLESIYRFAYFIPMHEKTSLELRVSSSKELSLAMIKLQLLAFSGSYQIDLWSAPIQKEGIPILYAELPNLLEDLGELA